MAEASRLARCAVSVAKYELCQNPAVPDDDAPFNICAHHMAEIIRYANTFDFGKAGDLMRENSRPQGPLGIRVPQLHRFRPLEPQQEPYRSVVYYIRVDTLIKIGYSGRVYARMKAYPPHAVLLATEPGNPDLERRRHNQFNRHLAAGREWFRPSPELIAHINSLREAPLTAEDFAA